MLETTRHLMSCGFQAVYGYTQSDEISILFHPNENSFSRKERKFISILAGEASARFSLSLGDIAAFDARIALLPTTALVVDYFRWRMEDAARNCLNGYCYWMLRKKGQSADQAAQALKGLGRALKQDLLLAEGINFNDIATWQKRGSGVYWQQAEKNGLDPRSGESVIASRRKLLIELELPIGDNYDDLVREFLTAES